MNRLVYEIIADATHFARGMSDAEANSARFTDAMRRLQQGAHLTIPEIQEALVAIGRVGRQARESGGDLDLLNKHTTLLTRAKQAIARELRAEREEMREAAAAARHQAELLQRLTLEHYDLNAAQQVVNRETRRYAAHARVKELSQERLVEMGIRTTDQIEEEIRQIELVMKMYERDEAVTLQLSAAKERLERSLGRVSHGQSRMLTEQRRANMMMTSGVRVLGHFGGAYSTVGNQVVYATQNIVMARQQMGSWRAAVGALTTSLMGPGALIVAAGAAAIAIKKISDRKKEAAKETEEYRKRMDALTRGLVQVTDVQELPGLQATIRQLQSMVSPIQEAQRRVEELEAAIQGQRGYRTGGPGLTATIVTPLHRDLASARTHLDAVTEALSPYQEMLDDATERWVAYWNAYNLGLRPPTAESAVRSLMEAERERLAELQRHLGELRGPEGERIIRLQLQADELERQRDALVRIRRIVGQMDREDVEGRRISVLPSRVQAQQSMHEARGPVAPDELRGTGMTDAEISDLDARTSAYEYHYRTIASLRLENQRDHKARLEEMGMSEAQFLFTTLAGMERIAMMAETTFGGFASLAEEMYERSEGAGRGWFAFHKAASIAAATASTYEAANKAWAQGGFFGGAMAAGVIAAGLANVSNIMRTNIGSSSSGGASGGRMAYNYSDTYQRFYPDDVVGAGYQRSSTAELTQATSELSQTLRSLQSDGVSFRQDVFTHAIREDQYLTEFLR